MPDTRSYTNRVTDTGLKEDRKGTSVLAVSASYLILVSW